MPNSPDGGDWAQMAGLEKCVRLLFSRCHDHLVDRFEKAITTKQALSTLLKGSFEEVCTATFPASPMTMELDYEACEANYRLEFTHDCVATACAEEKCNLCENNPKRRCGNQCFKKKYFMQEIIVARCGAPMRVRLVDMQTNETARLDTKVEACILNGPDFAQFFTNGIPNCADENLEACQEKWAGDQGPALLQSAYAANNAKSGLVEFRLKGGEAELPKLKVMHSSEALLGGRRTPFRLLVGVTGTGPLEPSLVTPAITDDFVVATQRSKLAQKKEVPLKHDQVSTLEQMGGQRVETLSRLGDVLMKQLSLSKLPRGWPKQVDTVDDFLKLAHAVKLDSRLRKKVTSMLRMSDNQWNEACDHAMTAVPSDSRLRVWWYRNGGELGPMVGLLYSCTLGEVDLTKPQGLVEVVEHTYNSISYDTAFREEQERMDELHKQAKECWSRPRHPGWGIYPTTQDFTSQDFQRNPEMLPSPPPRCVTPVRRKRKNSDFVAVTTVTSPMVVYQPATDFSFPTVCTVQHAEDVAMADDQASPTRSMSGERSPKAVIVTQPPITQPSPIMKPDPEPLEQRSPSPVPQDAASPPPPQNTDMPAPRPPGKPFNGTSLDLYRLQQQEQQQQQQQKKKVEGRSAELKSPQHDVSRFLNVKKLNE
ncbi:unnamed protein product [Ostreobium quekettii]|uniref:Uncharacterized protein n=1 Tax=Ostreobium quekettii TaxID=121088 RepID=A0A8S1J6D2_9CHLO|nr:unnamed protein product [Ostreobium quekettii]